MTHKEMAAHIRSRLAKAGIKARCKMDDYNGAKMICINSPKFGVEFTPAEQSAMLNIVTANRLTKINGLPVIDNGTHTFGGNFEFAQP